MATQLQFNEDFPDQSEGLFENVGNNSTQKTSEMGSNILNIDFIRNTSAVPQNNQIGTAINFQGGICQVQILDQNSLVQEYYDPQTGGFYFCQVPNPQQMIRNDQINSSILASQYGYTDGSISGTQWSGYDNRNDSFSVYNSMESVTREEKPRMMSSKNKSISERTYINCFLMHSLTQHGFEFEIRQVSKKSKVSDRLIIDKCFQNNVKIFDWETDLKKCKAEWLKQNANGSKKTTHDEHCSNYFMNLLIDKFNEIKGCHIESKYTSKRCNIECFDRKTIVYVEYLDQRLSLSEVLEKGKIIYDFIKNSNKTRLYWE